MSVVPPAVKETTNLMGLSGYSAHTVAPHRHKAKASQAVRQVVGRGEANRNGSSSRLVSPIMLSSGIEPQWN